MLRASEGTSEPLRTTSRRLDELYGILGGSWVIFSGGISSLIWVISIMTLLIIPVLTTHEPLQVGLERLVV